MLKSVALRTFATNSGIILVGLVNSVLLARWMGAQGRGEVAAAMLWPTLLIYISSMGMITATIYFSALPEAKSRTILTNGLLLAITQGAVILPIGFWVLPWLLASQPPEVVGAGRLYLLLVPLALATQYCVSILQGHLRMSAFNGLRMIVPVGYLVGVCGLWLSGHLSVRSIVVLHLFLNLVCLVAALISLAKGGTRPGVRPSGSLLKSMLRYGLKVQVGDLSQVMNLRLDQAMIAAMMPPKELGLYVVAVSCAATSQVLSTTARMVLTPSIARKDSAQEQILLLEDAFRKYWLFSGLSIFALALAIPFVLPLVFGAAFKEAVWPAEVLLWGALFIGGKDVLTGGAQAMGSPWLSSRAELVSAVVTIVLLVVLLPTFGIMGAAVATVVAYGTQLAMLVQGLQQKHNVSPRSLFRVRFGDLRLLMSVAYRARWA